MTSNDNQQYITVELFNSKMETLITQIQLGNEKLRNELNSKIDDAKLELRTEVNSAKIEMLGHSMYWGFAIMTLVLTVIAIFVPYFLSARRDKKTANSLSEEKVQKMIAEALRNMNANTIR